MIVALSDSHIPGRAERIPKEFLDYVEKADVSVHAGDLTSKRVLMDLRGRSTDLYAVQGNCDSLDLPKSEKFSFKGTMFGVYHGTGIKPRGDHDTLAESIASKIDCKVLIHGHTHIQESVGHKGKILLNPGSCTGVGGGTSDESSPQMSIIRRGENSLKVEELEKTGSGLNSKKIREFDLE